jgi:hypothetical protein
MPCRRLSGCTKSMSIDTHGESTSRLRVESARTT